MPYAGPFPQISESQAATHNLLLRLPPVMILDLEMVSLGFSLTHQCKLSEEAVQFDLLTALGTLKVRVDLDLINFLSDFFIPGWRSESTAALLLEWRTICTLTHLLNATPLAQQSPQFQNVTPCMSSQDAFTLPLRGQISTIEQTFGLEVTAKDGDRAGIEKVLREFDLQAKVASDLEFPLQVSLPSSQVDLERAQSLVPGDVLLLEISDPSALPANLRLPDGRVWKGFIVPEGRFHLENLTERRQSMDSTDQDAEVNEHAVVEPQIEGDPAVDMADFADLPVRLDFQFQNHNVPLAKFSTLSVGSLLDLGIDLGKPIEIKANGQLVGTGDLVEIGDRIGVQIQRWREAKVV